MQRPLTPQMQHLVTQLWKGGWRHGGECSHHERDNKAADTQPLFVYVSSNNSNEPKPSPSFCPKKSPGDSRTGSHREANVEGFKGGASGIASRVSQLPAESGAGCK